MENTSKIYESTFIVNASLDDAQIDSVIEKAKESVTKNGGEMRDLAKWGRKRFTFPIRKKNNGFYVVFEFTGSGDTVSKLERHYQLDENILRYLTILLDKKALQARVAPSELVKQAAETTGGPSQSSTRREPARVEAPATSPEATKESEKK
ncbi:MAG: 30S ribosomal protein S6 [Ignavibacteriales bacterium]|nr:30S ribosomal protein S6 [Ignavibacteriales bacterium]